jgi:hypothetical protein
MATVKFHDGHKTAPILTEGNVSPAILAQLFQYFNSYFHKSKISEDEKIRSALMSFHDIKIDNWVKNNQDRFLADGFTFELFTAELRKRFLDPNWESSIVRNIVNCQMTTNESFTTFANRVMQGNNLLIGTPSRLDTAALRSKLEINMSSYLADKISRLRATDKDRIKDITVFEDWLHEITLLDEENTADLKRIADFAAEHIAKRQRIDPPKNTQYNSFTTSQFTPLTGSNTVTVSQPPHMASNFSRGGFRGNNIQRAMAGTGKRTRCPKLLLNEIELLDKHNGCRKCRKFYVNHRAGPDCPNDFPNPDTYVTLTEDMAHQAMANAAIASTYNAPLQSNPNSSTYPYNAGPSAYVEEIRTNESSAASASSSIAAVLPSAAPISFALGTGPSDTESDESST